MKLLLCLAVSVWHVVQGVEPPETEIFVSDSPKAAEKMFKNQLRFAVQTYQALANLKNGSFALSTADAFFGLSQLYFGAQGECQKQLMNVLNYSPDDIEAQRGLAYLNREKHMLLFYGASTSSKIFHAYESNLENPFMEKMNTIFRSVPKRVSSWSQLASGSEIYNFVKNVGISNPSDQTVEGEESLVLASASIFSANLIVHNFHARSALGDFYFNKDNIIPNCEYVIITTKLNYGELIFSGVSNDRQADAQYIELTWALPDRWDIKSYIVLPSEEFGISELEKNINEATIGEMLSNTNMYTVNVTLLSRVWMENDNNLVKPFQNMNLTRIFEETTDFAKIVGNTTARVGAIFQQVEIDLSVKFNAKSYNDPGFGATKIFDAHRAFMILTVLKDEPPLILSMARIGWLPGVVNAET